VNILDIPGYASAIVRERFVRDAAFLGVTETVAGFELRPMTLRHLLLLRVVNSPLLRDETPSPIELAQFFWMTSAEYSLDDAARERFIKRCLKFTPPAPQYFETRRWRRRFNRAMFEMAEALAAARAYIAEAMMDRPASQPSIGYTPEYYSSVAWWVGLFEHRYTAEQILDMPLKVLYQYLNEIKDRASAGSKKKPVFCNPSDKVRGEWIAASNRN
jgi:hypothetical protein